MKACLSAAVLLTLSACASATLGVGDKAPPLKVADYVKGGAVSLDKGTHVVEFWATWCGPCRMSIPHLTELAKEFKGKVDFTGVSISEQGNDQLGQVKTFVKSMGPKMEYNVAFDGPSRFMATRWMDAAGQDGIPTAFVVRNGVILWIGHPMMGLEETLKKVTAGNFSVAEAKKAYAKQQAEMQAQAKQEAADQAEQQKLVQPYLDALRAGDLQAQIKALNDIEAKKPQMKEAIELTKAMPMISLGMKEGYDIARKASTTGMVKDNYQFMNTVAWTIVQPKPAAKNPDYAFALSFAKRALDLSNGNPTVRDTYALALWKTGDKAKAVEQETLAVADMKKDSTTPPETIKDCEGRLAEFKKG